MLATRPPWPSRPWSCYAMRRMGTTMRSIACVAVTAHDCNGGRKAGYHGGSEA